MNELDQLRKQNKQLKMLLKNAVELLNRYKDVLLQSAETPAKERRSVKKRKSVKKNTAKRL